MEGRCFCGQVRYQAQPPTDFAGHCHCQSCRLATGAPMVSWTSVERGRFQMVQGSEGLTRYASSEKVTWMFCRRCGSTLFYESTDTPERIYFTIATLTTPLDRDLASHVSVEEKPTWFEPCEALPRYFGKTEHRIEALHEAAREGHSQQVGLLLQLGFPPDLRLEGWTPLMWAARHGHLEASRLLLQAGAAALEGAYQVACSKERGCARLLDLFLDHGVSAQEMLPIVAEWSTVAAAGRLLKRGVDVNAPDQDGELPLYHASKRSVAMIRRLLKAGAEPLALNADGGHPLHYCAIFGHPRRLQALLDGGVPPDLLEDDVCTALANACDFGQYECAKILLEAAANPNLSGALTRACRFGSLSLVKLMLQHGASPTPEALQAASSPPKAARLPKNSNSRGETELHHVVDGHSMGARGTGHADILALLQKHPQGRAR